MIPKRLRRVRGLPQERPEEPPTGYKIAYLMLSADGTRIGFSGVSIGNRVVHGAVADAECMYQRRHRSPSRLCDCGFYCLHSLPEAQGLTCATEYRSAAVLEVGVLGHYIRYERGMRYSRQRVRAVRVGNCPCGEASGALVDSGVGRPGWRALTWLCPACAARRPALSFPAFARLSGTDLTVLCDEHVSSDPTGMVMPRETFDQDQDTRLAPDQLVPLLAAEVTLLQARIDRLQEQLSRLSNHPGT
jgi:hypothetical protein